MAKHGYGYVPDKKDERDFVYRSMRPMAAPLPAAVDLRKTCSPVRDQGQLGSCTGFAIAVGMREFLENKLGVTFVKLSPLFLYYEERLMEDTVNQDAGAMPRDGMKVLVNMGCAPEADDRYSVRRYKKAPAAQAVADAAAYKVASYHRLSGLSDIQACLAGGSGFVMGFTVYESFESQSVAETGKMPMPAKGESVMGGHAVFCAGYQTDASTAGGGYLIVKNSWGTGWGDKGYFYMPYAYVTPKLVSDAWVAVM